MHEFTVTGFPSAWFSTSASLDDDEHQRRINTEAEYCTNFVCCGMNLADMHKLLEHYEDMHSPGGDDMVDMTPVHYYDLSASCVSTVAPTPAPLSPSLSPVTSQWPTLVLQDEPEETLAGLLFNANLKLCNSSAESTSDSPELPLANILQSAVTVPSCATGITGDVKAPETPMAAQALGTNTIPPLDSGYASPGSGSRTPYISEEDFLLRAGSEVPTKSYSAFFGMFAEHAAGTTSPRQRTHSRRQDRRNGLEPYPLPSARGSSTCSNVGTPKYGSNARAVDLHLVTKKLSIQGKQDIGRTSCLATPDSAAPADGALGSGDCQALNSQLVALVLATGDDASGSVKKRQADGGRLNLSKSRQCGLCAPSAVGKPTTTTTTTKPMTVSTAMSTTELHDTSIKSMRTRNTKASNAALDEKKQWPCPVSSCGKRFRLPNGLKYHIENRHVNPPTHQV